MSHAFLSASGAKKWLACTPSPRLESKFADKRSEYAAEGSFAHKYAELLLNNQILKKFTKEEYEAKLKAMHADSFYSQSLENHVQDYIYFIFERYFEAKSKDEAAMLLIEEKLNFSRFVPDGFGTGDVLIIADNYIEIIDLKYGQGVPVSAEDNPQIRLYAIGALESYGCIYSIENIKMTIIQPRLDNISTENISADALYQWADKYVKPRAEMAFKGEGEYVPGDHCRFCKAKSICRKRAEHNLESAKYDFQPPETLTDEEIGEILLKAEQLKSWASDVSEYALNQALFNGKKWNGWKLVEGRSTRKYTNESDVVKQLFSAGYKEEDIFEKSLYGITALEKIIGKKKFETILSSHITKPPGKPTLVKDSDKRPEISSIQSAISDFSE